MKTHATAGAVLAVVLLAGCGEGPKPVEDEWTPEPLTADELLSLDRRERERDYYTRLIGIPYAKGDYQDVGLEEQDLARVGWIVCYRMNEQGVGWREASQGVADEYGLSWERGHSIVTRALGWLCPEEADTITYMPPKLLERLAAQERQAESTN